MKFGALFLLDPPAEQFVERAVLAERAGFDYVWAPDSHVIWEDPWPVLGAVARATERIRIGPLVTNPQTRHWTVVASLLATLNEVSGGRAVCGIGRGDSACRTIGLRPVSVRDFETRIVRIRQLAEGRVVDDGGISLRIPWVPEQQVEIWGAGYGPRVLDVVGRTCDGFVLQLADLEILMWTRASVLAGAEAAERPKRSVQVQVVAPAYVSTDRARAYDQLRWFAGSVGNHIADLVRSHGEQSVPQVLADYIRHRPEYDYMQHDKAGNPLTDYVPDEITERFCLIGPAEEHVARIEQLGGAGVDLYTVLFAHDLIDRTFDAYRDEVIPAIRESAGVIDRK